MSELMRKQYECFTVDVARLAELLDAGTQYAILIHRHPDGDAVCSAVALCLILQQKGKQCRICCADAVPQYLRGLCPLPVETEPVFGETELLVTVDVAEPALLGTLAQSALSKGVYLKLDHHRSGADFAAHNMVDPDASAAGELVYRLAKQLGIRKEEVLLACYGAVASDTGGFRYANATAGAFAMAADMRMQGLCFEDVNAALFESKDRRTLQATAYGVGKTEFYFGARAAVCVMERAEMDARGFADEHLSELGSTLREIEGVCMAAVLREEKEGGSYRLSTRSNKNADCIALCSAFGGGGHLRAAGATVKAENAVAAKDAVLRELARQFEKEEKE